MIWRILILATFSIYYFRQKLITLPSYELCHNWKANGLSKSGAKNCGHGGHFERLFQPSTLSSYRSDR